MGFALAIWILGFMSPSAISLIYAWWAWAKSKTDPTKGKEDWRVHLLSIGLVLASVSQCLATAFLLSHFHSNEQSFVERVSLLWAIANWTTLLSWILVLATVAFGRGRVRRPLLAWVLIMPVASWIIIMMGYDY